QAAAPVGVPVASGVGMSVAASAGDSDAPGEGVGSGVLVGRSEVGVPAGPGVGISPPSKRGRLQPVSMRLSAAATATNRNLVVCDEFIPGSIAQLRWRC